jgi:hypothetical protein
VAPSVGRRLVGVQAEQPEEREPRYRTCAAAVDVPADGSVVSRASARRGHRDRLSGSAAMRATPCAQAAAARRVCGQLGMSAMGMLVIIKHNETYLKPTGTTASCRDAGTGRRART